MLKEHSNFMKGIVVGMMLCHKSSKAIQKKTGLSKSTQKRFFETYLQEPKVDPDKLTHLFNRKIVISDEVTGKIRKALNTDRHLTARGIE